MYESPIKIIESAIDSFTKSLVKEKEDAIILEVKRSLGVEVDRGELLRAMQYDRFQYDKGYADGKRDAMESVVRCKDCIHCEEAFDDYWCNYPWNWHCPPKPKCVKADGFCHNGERREGE